MFLRTRLIRPQAEKPPKLTRQDRARLSKRALRSYTCHGDRCSYSATDNLLTRLEQTDPVEAGELRRAEYILLSSELRLFGYPFMGFLAGFYSTGLIEHFSKNPDLSPTKVIATLIFGAAVGVVIGYIKYRSAETAFLSWVATVESQLPAEVGVSISRASRIAEST